MRVPALRLTVVAFVLSAPAPFAQTTWHVDQNGTPPGSGTLLDPYTSIQLAIALPTTSAGDTVLVHPGTYVENVDFVGKDLHVVSAAGPDVTTIDGNQLSSVVVFVNGEGAGARLEGFTLTNGSGYDGAANSPSGGGIYCLGASPTIVDCVIEENGDFSLLSGGGICADNSTLSAFGCRIVSNDASSVGGGLAANNSVVQLVGCELRDNITFLGEGGGAWINAGSYVISGSSIADNLAPEGGGGGLYMISTSGLISGCSIVDNVTFNDHWGAGVSFFGGSSTLIDSVVARNEGAGGAGVFASAAQLTIASCSIVDNVSEAFRALGADGVGLLLNSGATADVRHTVFARNESKPSIGEARGGAVFGPATLKNCTLARNIAADAGGGAWGATLDSCIVWGNVPDQLGGGATADYSDVQGGWPGTANLNADPDFWNPVSGDYHLMTGSPCIDAGNPSCPTDADGSTTDMGAFPFDGQYCGSPGTYCTTKVSSAGCEPAIAYSGSPTLSGPDDFRVSATEILNNQNGILFWGTSPANAPFLGGTLCVQNPVIRTDVQNSGGALPGTDCSGTFNFQFTHAYMAQEGIGAGTRIYAQYWYRDPGQADGTGVGLSDAVEFTVCP